MQNCLINMHRILGEKAHGKGKRVQKLDLGQPFSFHARKIFMEKAKSRCSTNNLRKEEKKKPLAKVNQIVPTATSRYLSTGLTLVIEFFGKIFGSFMQKVLGTYS